MSPRPTVVSRQSVLEIAERLFRDQGIRATGVADIAAEAGCGKQALYRVFASKDELVAGYLERRLVERESATRAALRDAGDEPADQLVALIAEVASWTRSPDYRGCVVRNYLREYPDDGAAKRVADDFMTTSYERVQRLASAAGPDRAMRLTNAVWLIHEGLYASYGSAPEAGAASVALVSTLIAGQPD